MEIMNAYSNTKQISDIILSAGTGKKFLVFEKSGKIKRLETNLRHNRKVNVAHLKGNGVTIKKTIRKFNTGNIQVLIMASKMGAGLNLEKTNGIICTHEMPPTRFKQMVGRGQRHGRNGSLVVHHLQPDVADTLESDEEEDEDAPENQDDAQMEEADNTPMEEDEADAEDDDVPPSPPESEDEPETDAEEDD